MAETKTKPELMAQAQELLLKIGKVRMQKGLLDKALSEKREEILRPVRQKIEKLMEPYNKQLQKVVDENAAKLGELNERDAKLEARIKELVIACKETVKTDIMYGVFNKPKVTYNIDKLEAMREFVPQLNTARTEAEEGTCTVRKAP